MTQIKAEELRSGNLFLILHEESETQTIATWEHIRNLHKYEQNPDDERYSRGGPEYAGLPITEELLLKAGFEKNHSKSIFKNVSNNYWVSSCVCLFYPETLPENTYLLGYGFMHDGEYYASTSQWIKYVHELQNAYKVLTGKELTL